ncbi:hypothetical protein OPV22_006009 [Ensete ventricosum]|uniref:P-type H(+)-exporting transporter n=1 Tax=Ensete ventricosum TaxID=4639 RepID=A0AAV8RS71_ENSVE|nr:hypothetical protein OPV22_006009 [Ensete ventricosum]
MAGSDATAPPNGQTLDRHKAAPSSAASSPPFPPPATLRPETQHLLSSGRILQKLSDTNLYLDKPLLDPENFTRDSIDLERMPLEEVFEQLRTSQGGLSSADAELRLQLFGLNKLEEKPENKFLKFLSFMWNPLSWVTEAAAVMAIALANGGGQGPDWQDFVGIICLLILNSTISFIEENNAGNAAAALMARLAPKCKVLRDDQWQEKDAAILVPGDIISIKLGDIIPADARLLEGDPLKVDQSALTGESLPVTKMTDSTEVVGHFQKVLTSIGNFCICSIAVGMILEIIVMFPIQHRSYRDGINNLLVLLIGGIPIAMPTVLSGAITKRMTAIEELAGMDVLCSDKTGTLTLNRLTVDRNLIEVFSEGMDKDIIVLLAARASRLENQDAIDTAIISMLADPKEARANITEVHFFPFNPVDKRTAITYIDSDGNWYRASKGAPEQILDLCHNKGKISGKVHAIIDKFAERGLRSLGVAYQAIPEKTKENSDGFAGVFPEHNAVLTSRAIFQRMKNYTIYAVSITIRIVLGFMLLALIWEYDFPPFMVLIIAILNDGTIMTISKDRFFFIGLSSRLTSLRLISKLELSAAALKSSAGCHPDCSLCTYQLCIDSCGEAWNLLFDRKTAFTSRKDYGKEDRKAQWVISQQSLQGLISSDIIANGRRSSLIAEQAKRRAEIARLGEIHTLRGHVESVVRLKKLDINVIQTAHTV